MEGVLERASSKEEAEKHRKKLGTVTVPAGTESWMRWVDKEGNVWTQPPVTKALSPEEKAKREAEAKVRSENYKKKQLASANKKIADNQKRKKRIEDQLAKIKEAEEEAEAKKKKLEGDDQQ